MLNGARFANQICTEDDKHKIFGVSSPFAEITILEMCGHRDLYTGNNIQASEVDEFIYHEALVHPGMAAFQHFHGSLAAAWVGSYYWTRPENSVSKYHLLRQTFSDGIEEWMLE